MEFNSLSATAGTPAQKISEDKHHALRISRIGQLVSNNRRAGNLTDFRFRLIFAFIFLHSSCSKQENTCQTPLLLSGTGQAGSRKLSVLSK